MEPLKGIEKMAHELAKAKEPFDKFAHIQRLVAPVRIPKGIADFMIDSAKPYNRIDTVMANMSKFSFYEVPEIQRTLHQIASRNEAMQKGIFAARVTSNMLDTPMMRTFRDTQSALSYLERAQVRANKAGNIFYGEPKRSRIMTSLLENALNIYKVDYDLAKAVEAEPEAGSSIIMPPALIKDARAIRKVIAEIYRDNSKIFDIAPRQFEELIAEMLDKRGYTVELTKQTRDGGYDILALRQDNGMPLKYLAECKRNRKDRTVGVGIIRSFSDVVKEEGANKGLIFTTSYFSEDARKRQRKDPYLLELKDHDEVINWVENYMLNA